MPPCRRRRLRDRPHVLAPARGDSRRARVRPLSRRAPISREREPAVLHSLSAAARAARHDGRIHPAALTAVRSPHALRHWRRGSVRRHHRRDSDVCCVGLAHSATVSARRCAARASVHRRRGLAFAARRFAPALALQGDRRRARNARAHAARDRGMDWAVHHAASTCFRSRSSMVATSPTRSSAIAQPWIARFFWLLLIPMGRLWQGWWLWAVLALVIGRGQLGHPMLIAPERPLDTKRRMLAWLAIVLLGVDVYAGSDLFPRLARIVRTASSAPDASRNRRACA